MADQLPGPRRQKRGSLLFILLLVVVLLLCSRFLAGMLIDYRWWQGMHQLDTWFSLLLYGWGPAAAAAVVLFAAFFGAFQAGMRHQERSVLLFGFLSRGLLNRIALLVFALFAIFIANVNVESWTVVRYFGGLRLAEAAGEYVDPIFHKPLTFYFFGLPFYNLLLQVVLVGTVLTLVIYWAARNLESLEGRLPRFPTTAGEPFPFHALPLQANFTAGFVRIGIAIFLIALAIKIFFDRYALLLGDHGQHLVGIDWIGDHLVIPLQWMLIAGALAAAALVMAKRGKLALLALLLLPVRFLLPAIVSSLYVRPNELALERPYIQHHIDATRSAYKLNTRVKEVVEEAEPEIAIDRAKHEAVLDNVRLWDWRAFHDTISQIQPLRPYVYMDTDVDRYTIDGKLRQVLIAPRELDTRQLGPAGGRWINTHLMYTHGYGIVMAEANRITPDGLPVLFVKDAPPVVTSKSLRLTQPEIYYSEVAHEPVYVNTAQQEFNYPSGSESQYTNYAGRGGFSMSPLTRLAAAIYYGDLNVLLTSYLTSGSRMMIRRPVLDRLHSLAGFLTWDSDPYLVLTDAGRLVWMVDGYMSSDAHPYSRALNIGGDNGTTVNYIRNSVKATVDAYSGETNLYVFDAGDVLIQAYQRLFPQLFKPVSAMPADLRRHARYPETLFSAQAEIYRAFHMRDPEAFYNRADLWDLAKTGSRGAEGATAVSPTYVVAALPGSDTAEFMLFTTFTPANKDNLIGVMYARCDGDHLGELQFAQLSKQNIIFGPMQIDARVNQDQNISKDLSLWNQQGSQVLRGQTLVLPLDNSFLYVEPIYIQAAQASMPQLKKVALAMGNRLAYADTYEQALAQLTGQEQEQAAPAAAQASAPTPAAQPQANPAAEKVDQIRAHLARYRELSAQGKWAEAGKELDAIQRLVQK